jgi:hypothetical protein
MKTNKMNMTSNLLLPLPLPLPLLLVTPLMKFPPLPLPLPHLLLTPQGHEGLGP